MQLTLNFILPLVNPDRLDLFTRYYINEALWTSTDDNGDPLCARYMVYDIHPDTLAKMAADCAEFQRKHGVYTYYSQGRAGADFWLTRNRHGSGFWDGGWIEVVGNRLTEAAHGFGEFNLYLGDDGKIHGI